MKDEVIIIYSVEEYPLFKDRKESKIIYMTSNHHEAVHYLNKHRQPKKGYIIYKDTYVNNYLTEHEILEWVETYARGNMRRNMELDELHEKKPRNIYDTTTGIKNLRKTPNEGYSRGYCYIYNFKDNKGNKKTLSAPTLELIRQRVWRKHQSWTIIDQERYDTIKEQAKKEEI